MSNWITGKDLVAYWNIEDFELFDCLKKGLQPYTPNGQKIADTDTLEHGREHTLEYFRRYVSGGYCEDSAKYYPAFERMMAGPRLTMEAIAKKLFYSQPPIPLNPPTHYMSFTLPDDVKNANTEIQKLMSSKFRKDEASEFAEKHGYRVLDKQKHDIVQQPNKETINGETIPEGIQLDDPQEVLFENEGEKPHISHLEADMDEGDRLDENLRTGFSHSPDYRSVTKDGKQHSLSTNQAAVVECLHEAFKDGNPELSQDYIFERIGSSANNPRMRDTFKSNLEAKEDLIAPGERKGVLRLNI